MNSYKGQSLVVEPALLDCSGDSGLTGLIRAVKSEAGRAVKVHRQQPGMGRPSEPELAYPLFVCVMSLEQDVLDKATKVGEISRVVNGSRKVLNGFVSTEAARASRDLPPHLIKIRIDNISDKSNFRNSALCWTKYTGKKKRVQVLGRI